MARRLGSDENLKFLQKYVTKKGNEYTHTSIGSPKISLYVSDQAYPTFMEEYQTALIHGVALHLTEKPKDPSPFRVDMDFRFAGGSNSTEASTSKPVLPRIYTKFDIERIVLRYSQLFQEYLCVDSEDLVGYVMEKESPTEYKGKLKDGLHIIFPKVIVSHAFQHFIRHRILAEASRLFEGLPLTNSYENIIDEAIIDRNNWQMYGSSKPDCEPYRVTCIYEYDASTDSLQELCLPNPTERLEWCKTLSMRQQATLVPYQPKKQAEIDEFIRVILPTMLHRRKDSLHQQVFG